MKAPKDYNEFMSVLASQMHSLTYDMTEFCEHLNKTTPRVFEIESRDLASCTLIAKAANELLLRLLSIKNLNDLREENARIKAAHGVTE